MERTVENKYSLMNPSHRCSTCDGEVAAGASFFSAVVVEQEGFLRRDFCLPCWERLDPEAVTAERTFFAYWRARRPEPEAPPARRRFDPEILWTFFLRLQADLCRAGDGAAAEGGGAGGAHPVATEQAGEAASADPPGAAGAPGDAAERAPISNAEKTRLLFLIALLLVRAKRLLLGPSAVREGREWLKLTRKGEPGETYLIEDPRLASEDLERIKESLGDLLQMEI